MLFSTALASAQEPVTLKVTRGKRDIVNISNPTIVGIANPTDKVTVNGTAFDQNAPVAVNFTKNVKIAITSESGSTKTYTVLAKNGNVNIDNRVYEFMKKHNLPGVSIAISKAEEIVYRAGYGFADKSKEELTTCSDWQVCQNNMQLLQLCLYMSKVL